eukprot:CAMPEP_0172832060 /NCGR_PEP_ID=MMETSP1075-20121228/23407_1 /TAXON_ID=2916 /ORGANISM="Ceratium fusus, Strain PA161109" /LENGTH=209 /DNA_ID=CAMNT_0013674611 /DNA_START=353 /DNA_END=982 /DNA_ORIENTATION=-
MLNTARHKDEGSPGQQEGAAEVDGLTSGVQSVGRKVTACVCTIWLHTNNVEHNVVNASIDATCQKKRAVDEGDVLHQLELVWLSNDEKKKQQCEPCNPNAKACCQSQCDAHVEQGILQLAEDAPVKGSHGIKHLAAPPTRGEEYLLFANICQLLVAGHDQGLLPGVAERHVKRGHEIVPGIINCCFNGPLHPLTHVWVCKCQLLKVVAD